MPFNLGGPELVFILVIVLIVFGAGKLPDVLGQLGRGVKSFRDEAGNEKTASVAAAPGGQIFERDAQHIVTHERG